MTDHRQPVPSDRARIEVRDTTVVPGRPAAVVVQLTNIGSTPSAFTVELVGVPGVAPEPAAVPTLAVGEGVEVELPIELPTGFPPSRQLIGVAATPEDGSAPVRAELQLLIAGGEGLVAELRPPLVRGRGTERFHVDLRNDGPEPLSVTLSGLAPQGGLDVHLSREAVELDPGAHVRIPARVSGRGAPPGHGQRLPFGVRIDGAAAPIHLEGAFAQRAMVPITGMKAVGILVVVALWVAALGIGLDRLTNDDRGTNTSEVAEGSPAPGGGSGGAGGGGSGQAGGTGDEGDRADVSGAQRIAAVGRIGGTVAAPDPSGVLVTLKPAPLASEDTDGAEPLGFRRGAAAGKLVNHTTNSQQLGETRSVVTDPTGQWAFTGLRAPAYYLVTFSKAGYGTRSNVVQVNEDAEPVVVDVLLQPGHGGVSGTVVGPDGPLGAVDITVTDGTVTLSTRTPSEGKDVGAWSIEGLPAPGTFLVTATRDGFGTQTALVDVGAGGQSKAVEISMRPGVGTITGTAISNAGGVGNLTVTLKDAEGKEVRKATTLTEGSVGGFTLPDLKIPGDYLVTVTGAGYATSTQQVALEGNATIQVPIERTTGEITGLVREAGGGPFLANVGVTVRADDDTRYSTTSVDTPPGEYSLIGVPPGTYAVTFERFGYEPTSQLISLGRGEQTQLPTVEMRKLAPAELRGEGSITGVVTDASVAQGGPTTDSGIPGVTVRVVELPSLSAVTDKNGNYTIEGVPPGVFNLQFDSDPAGIGYEQKRTRVKVAFKQDVSDPGTSPNLQPYSSLTVHVDSSSRAASNLSQYNVPIAGTTVTMQAAIPRWVYDEATQTFTRETEQIVLSAAADANGDAVFHQRLPILSGSSVTPYTATVTQPGFDARTRQVNVAPGENDRVIVALNQQPVLAVKILYPKDATGELVAGTATVVPVGTSDPVDQARTVGVVPVFDGTSGLTPGMDVTVSATLPTGETGVLRDAAGNPLQVRLVSNEVREVSVTVIPIFEGALTGRVVWQDLPAGQGDTLVTGTTQILVTGIFGYDNDGRPLPETTKEVTATDGVFTIPTDKLPLSGAATLRVPATPQFREATAGIKYGALLDNKPETHAESPTIVLTGIEAPLRGTIDTHGTLLHPISAKPISVQVLSAPMTQPLDRLSSYVDPSSGRFQLFDTGLSPVSTCRSTISDECAVRPGAYTLRLTGADFTPEDVGGFVGGQGTFRVEPGTPNTSLAASMWKDGQVRLRAKDTSSPTAAAGATFTIVGVSDVTGQPVTATATADEAGRATVSLQPGQYRYTASLEGWRPETNQPGDCEDHEDSICFTVETDELTDTDKDPGPFLLAQLGSITGTVVGRLGSRTSPIGVPVTVTATDSASPAHTFTATASPSDGRFTIKGATGLEPGRYTVTIAAPDTPEGYEPLAQPVEVNVSSGPVSIPNLVLESKPATIEGHVFEIVGGTPQNPVTTGASGVTVTLTVPGQTPRETVSAADGSYRFENVPAINPAALAFSKPGVYFVSSSSIVDLERGKTSFPVDYLTPIDVSLTVRVLGSYHTGTGGTPPVQGAEVRAVRIDIADEADRTGTTGANGDASLTLKVGARYRIEASAAGYALLDTSAFPILEPGGKTTSLTITLAPVHRKVRVTVTSAVAGAAVPEHTAVELQPDGDGREVTATGDTDSKGLAEISDVLPGRYTLVVTGTDGRGSARSSVEVPLDPGQSDDTATPFDTGAVLQEAKISGQVVVENVKGNSAANATVTITHPDGTTQQDTVSLTETGVRSTGPYSFFVPAAGTYTLKAVVDTPAGVYPDASLEVAVAIGDNLTGKNLEIDPTPPTTTTTEAPTTTTTEPPEPTTTSTAQGPP